MKNDNEIILIDEYIDILASKNKYKNRVSNITSKIRDTINKVYTEEEIKNKINAGNNDDIKAIEFLLHYYLNKGDIENYFLWSEKKLKKLEKDIDSLLLLTPGLLNNESLINSYNYLFISYKQLLDLYIDRIYRYNELTKLDKAINLCNKMMNLLDQYVNKTGNVLPDDVFDYVIIDDFYSDYADLYYTIKIDYENAIKIYKKLYNMIKSDKINGQLRKGILKEALFRIAFSYRKLS